MVNDFNWEPSYPVERTPLFKTIRHPFDRGKEQRLALWSKPKHTFKLKFDSRRQQVAREIYDFFIARKGAYESFRIKDWIDNHHMYDNFDNGAIGSQWTQDAGNGTIAEDTALHLSIANSVQGIWQGAITETSPRAYQSLQTTEYRCTVKLKSYAVNEDTHAGIALFLDRSNAYLWGRLKDSTLSQDGLYLAKIDVDQYQIQAEHAIQPGNQLLGYGIQIGTYYPELLDSNNVTTLPIWLRVGYKDSNYTFDYSTDGSTFVTEYTMASSVFTPSYVGPFARNWGVMNALSADFSEFNPIYYRTVRFADDTLSEEMFTYLVFNQGLDLIEVF